MKSHTGPDMVSGVSAEPRERLIAAITKAVAERGYTNTTVADIAQHAGLPPDVFYDCFPDKGHCLLAAYEDFFERLWLAVTEASAAQPDWPSQVRAAVGAGLDFIVEVAAPARAFVVEGPAFAGPAATERLMASVERFARLLRSGRDQYPDAASLPPSTELTLIGGIAQLVSRHLLAEEPDVLPGLAPELVELVLIPYLGRDTAKRLATAEQ